MKFYCVLMLLYLFGKLYMGYVCNYMINDVMYCYLWMNGYNMLMLMGWDVFGMLVENVVMVNGVLFVKWIYDNIVYMKG